MSSFSILLRVLLCLSVALYGSGAATAATHMQIGHGNVAGATGPTHAGAAEAGTAPCSDASEVGLSAAHEAPAGEDGGSSTAAESADCCKATSCDCSCANPAQVATIALTAGGAAAAHSVVASPMGTGHTAPALPHLIRPPIG